MTLCSGPFAVVPTLAVDLLDAIEPTTHAQTSGAGNGLVTRHGATLRVTTRAVAGTITQARPSRPCRPHGRVPSGSSSRSRSPLSPGTAS